VQEAHGFCDHLEHDIESYLPHTRVVIHVEPCNQERCPNRDKDDRDLDACILRETVRATPRTQ
jgi:divalent metal cation (Fe/Co/Zn/Cd) transporter